MFNEVTLGGLVGGSWSWVRPSYDCALGASQAARVVKNLPASAGHAGDAGSAPG